MVLSHGAPFRSRVERRLPALSSLRGHNPAQETRWPASGIGADLGEDDLRGQITDSRDGPQLSHRLTERVEVTIDLGIDFGDRGLEGIDLAQVQA